MSSKADAVQFVYQLKNHQPLMADCIPTSYIEAGEQREPLPPEDLSNVACLGPGFYNWTMYLQWSK